MHASIFSIILYGKLEGFYQIACITGTLWAKRGERGILREARNEYEAWDEGRRKVKRLLPVHCSGFFVKILQLCDMQGEWQHFYLIQWTLICIWWLYRG